MVDEYIIITDKISRYAETISGINEELLSNNKNMNELDTIMRL